MADKVIMLYDKHRKKTYNVGSYDIENLVITQGLIDNLLEAWTARYHPTSELEYKQVVKADIKECGFRDFKDFLYTCNRLALAGQPEVVILSEAYEQLRLEWTV